MNLSNSENLQWGNWRQYVNWIMAALVGGFIIAYPSAAVGVIGEKYATQRIAQIALLLIVGILILIWFAHNLFNASSTHLFKQQNQHHKTIALSVPTTTDWLLIFVALLGLISSLLATHIEFALLEWSYTILLVALAYTISYWIQSNQVQHWQQWVAVTVIASLGVYFFLTLIYLAASLTNGYRYRTGLLFDIGFENPRFAAGYQVLLLPLLFWLSKIDIGWIRRYRFIVYTLSGFCLMLCVVTQSRGTLLFLIGATILVTTINRQALKSWMRFLLFSSIVGIALGFAMFWLPQQMGWILEVEWGLRTNIADIAGLSKREEIWLFAASHIHSAPLWGIGPMHFAAFDNKGYGSHPHNIYLQFWSEWGSISFLLLLGLVFVALKKIILNAKHLFTRIASVGATNNKLLSENYYALSVALVAAYGGMLFFGLVDGLFVYPVTQVIIAVLIGLGIGITKATNTGLVVNIDTSFKQDSSQKKQLYRPYQLRALCVIVLMFLSITTVIKIVPIQIPNTEIDEEHYLELHPKYQVAPRFWRQGWFNYDAFYTHKASKPSPNSDQAKQ